MAIYAADIQINVKNKGELRTLESRFKKIETAAVSLNKTLKGLGRRNAIKVDTRAAMSAISALEARIRGLSRTVNIDARTRESRSGGGVAGGAGLPLAAAAFSGGMGRRGMDSFERITKKQMDYVDQRIAQIERKFDTRASSATNPVAAKMAKLKAERSILGNEARAIQNDFQTRLKQQSFRQLRRDIAASERRYQDLLASPPPKPRSKFEGLTRQTRKAWVDELRAERAFGNKLKSQLPDAFEAGAGPTRQIEERMGKINELARQQANLKKVAEGENQVTQARVRGNAVRNKVRTLEDKIEQSQVNVARSQSKGEKITEDLAAARAKQEQALKKLTATQKSFNTRQAKQKTALDLEKQLVTATKNRAKAQQELNKWTKAQQNQIDRFGPNNIRRDFSKPGGAIDRSTKALKEADQKVAEINSKLQKSGRAADWSKPLNNAKQAFKGVKAEADALGQALDRNNRRLAQGNQILGKRKRAQALGQMKGAALRGAGASAALIPGISPLAVGGFAGAAGGGGMAGGAVGVAIAAAVQGTVALGNFIRQSTIAAAEMKKMELALTAVVSTNLEYNNALKSIDEISNRLLIPQAEVTKSFTRLQAAASASGFEVNDVKNMMEGFSAALVATEGDTRNFNGVMLALGQVMGKGKAAAEELRGQIGERLSVVIPELAASMGVTTKELDKLFEQGKVTVQNIVDLGEHLEKKYGESADKIIQSSMNAGQRLKFHMSKLQLALGPIFTDIGAGFQDLATEIVKAITPAIEALAKLMGLTKEGAAIKLASLGATEIEQRERANKVFEKSWIADDRLKEASMREDGLEWLRKHQQSRGQERLGISSSDLAAIRAHEMTLKRMEKWNKILNPDISGTTGKKTDGDGSDAKLQASWEKALQRLKDQKEFQDKLNEGGTAYAERWRKINEIASQFPTKPREEIEELVTAIEKAEKAGKSAKAVLNDWLDELEERLKELKNPMEQFKSLVEAASDSFQSDFKEMIRGTMSVGDAFVNMFNRIADAYLDMVAEMIVAQAKMRLGQFVGNIFGSGLSGPAPNIQTNAPGVSGTVHTGMWAAAAGGYVDRPTNALIGDNGPEYVLRDDQMAGALARYASGQRGQSVIPGGSYSDQPRGGGGDITVAYTGPTLNFNGDEYVPKSSVPEIINAAAKQGASAGQAKALSSLKNSRSARSRVGI